MTLPFENRIRVPLEVSFFDLEDFLHGDDPESRGAHKKVCPACKEGLLLLCRHPETLILSEYDMCTLCGQRVVYRDIERVRRERP